MSGGGGSSVVMVRSPAWMVMVRWRRRVLTRCWMLTLVRFSGQRAMARVVKTMVRWALMESRLWW